MLTTTIIEGFGVLGVIGIVIAAILVTSVGVCIYNLFDTSPTKDDRCRGGHDFWFFLKT